ncbi:MAG: ABC transporter permease [Promethearchaeota archaeon]
MQISKSYLRLFIRGIVFSTRSRKRLIVFLIVFTILSGMTILLAERWVQYDRHELLNQRGVILRNENFENVTAAQGDSLSGAINQLDNVDVESVNVIKYFNFGDNDTGLRIFGIDINKRWQFDVVNPSTIIKGTYLATENQILVADTAQFRAAYTQNDSYILMDIEPGNTLSFRNPDPGKEESQNYQVVGVFEEVTEIKADPTDRHWVIFTTNGFNKLVTYLNIQTQVYTYEITAIVAGNPLLPFLGADAYALTDTLTTEINNLITTGSYGVWSQPESTSSIEKIRFRDQDLLMFGFGIFGSLVVATLYAYLISRFRRREIAILKALGYKANHVRMGLLAEILTVAGLGYVIAASGIVFVLTQLTAVVFEKGVQPLSLVVALGSVVLLTVPGMLLASRRVLSVRPIEIFRER